MAGNIMLVMPQFNFRTLKSRYYPTPIALLKKNLSALANNVR